MTDILRGAGRLTHHEDVEVMVGVGVMVVAETGKILLLSFSFVGSPRG